MATPIGQPFTAWFTTQQPPVGLVPLPRTKACFYNDDRNCIHCADAHKQTEQVYPHVFPQDDAPPTIPHVPTPPS